ncbi:isochorismatase family protein [Microbacterium sp. SLBN-111]|uniref:isochorismatase family protein n=1 Tax=Microbacterium sp. SLBN-111 TaxID=3377733 RepID=UPI003C74818D
MTAREGVQSDAEAGFGRRLTPGASPALVVVDMVRAYFEPGEQLYMGLDDCLLSAERVLAAARRAGIPVLHTTVSFVEGGMDGGYFFQKVGALSVFVGDQPGGRPMPQVAPLPGEPVLVKQYASAFFGTSLASTLRAQGVDTVIVVGVSTSGCIRATAVDALQHGFIPLVVRDAVGDRADGPHEANLFDIQAKYGEVLGEGAVLEYLGGVTR